ncbi:SO_0444 family Cu/Zn efflux transporter [Pseudoalteromonas sp. MMG010]|uniref:SO_0444 family Cu/Zn efflux transporter n=1 Tax=Pseudoalteromonas sp. MMG010 TaxID=2822685 RepID=UPI001B39F844|nr:SO_0444 family Cu/Zn efflux transporter [Pseudoalteromonas sp. MMG010]MBQ4832868.1 SO_0444 family Cu/Zn efflux transporter [Pseudoalteromonas sp. MMG010]
MELIYNFWQLFLLSAPWLMLGLLIAGILNVYLPTDFLNKHLGKEGFWTTIKAALIGAPLPLCSCGVIPAAIGLRRAGASKSATTAFLVSTPETGVDSVSVSYVLLGPFMAIIRPIAAVISAVVAGLLVGREDKQTRANDENTPKSESSCCTSHQVVAKEVCCDTEKLKAEEHASCCAPKKPALDASCCSSSAQPVKKISVWHKLKSAVSFSCNKLLEDTMTWLLIGLFFAALVQTYVPAHFLTQWGSGVLAMIMVIVVSIPMYICATASTPIAAGLLMSGVSPGAVLVFMLAGPATNIATLGVVAKELGRRAVAAYLIGVIGVAVLFGFLTDYLVAEFGFVVSPLLQQEHDILPHWLSLICGVVLVALMLRLMFKWVTNKIYVTSN